MYLNAHKYNVHKIHVQVALITLVAGISLLFSHPNNISFVQKMRENISTTKNTLIHEMAVGQLWSSMLTKIF